MTLRKSNILDKIGSLIPGYNGYVVRDELRNTDKKLRENLVRILKDAETLISTHQKKLININALQSCQEWEFSRKSLNTLFTKIKNTTYGASSFFSKNQIDEEELEKINTYDLEIAERVSLISKTVQEDIDEVLSPLFVIEQIRAIENILIQRINFINQYK